MLTNMLENVRGEGARNVIGRCQECIPHIAKTNIPTCRGGGEWRKGESRWIAIHIPPYKKYISDIRPASVIPLYLMVGKIQLWVHYLAIPYGMENPVVGQCTKKPQWSAEAFGG